jgi:hypothetical protein
MGRLSDTQPCHPVRSVSGNLVPGLILPIPVVKVHVRKCLDLRPGPLLQEPPQELTPAGQMRAGKKGELYMLVRKEGSLIVERPRHVEQAKSLIIEPVHPPKLQYPLCTPFVNRTVCPREDVVVDHVPDLGGKTKEGKDTKALEARRSCQ